MVDSRPRLHGGRLFAGMGMGPRIREDNGRGRGSIGRELGRKMDCRPRLHGGGLCAGDGDGSPHPRGQWEGAREFGRELGRGWIVVPVFTGALCGGWGWVPACEDNGRGRGGGQVFLGEGVGGWVGGLVLA